MYIIEYAYDRTVKNIQGYIEDWKYKGETSFILIHGRRIELQIDAPEESTDKIENYKVAKLFLSYVQEKIENRINTRHLINTAIRDCNQALLKGVHNGENTVSV